MKLVSIPLDCKVQIVDSCSFSAATALLSTASLFHRDQVLRHQVAKKKPTTSIAAGIDYVCAIIDGYLYVCGDNKSISPGHDRQACGTEFILHNKFCDDITAIEVACGLFHTVIRASDGCLYVSGLNDQGQLSVDHRDSLVQFGVARGIPADVVVTQVSCGSRHTIIVTNNGLFSCGHNQFGQLGLGDVVSRRLFVAIANFSTDMSVKQLVCVCDHSMVLTASGYLYVCGENKRGQLGIAGNNHLFFVWVDITLRIAQLASSYDHSIILSSDGKLFGCGQASYMGVGRINDSIIRRSFYPIAFAVAQVVQVYCGVKCTGLLTLDNSLYVTGTNEYGRLGLGDVDDRLEFVQVNDLPDDFEIAKIDGSDWFLMMISTKGDILASGLPAPFMPFGPMAPSEEKRDVSHYFQPVYCSRYGLFHQEIPPFSSIAHDCDAAVRCGKTDFLNYIY